MLKGHVFLYQIFGNEICAKVFDTVALNKNGIFKDYGNEMEVTYNGSDITIASGVAMIGGRPIQETSSTTLDAGTNTLYCKLVLTVDLDQTNTQADFNQGFYEIVTNASNYPSVTQDDIVNNQSGKYQFELAQFTTGISGIENFVDLRTYIEIPQVINDMNTLEDQTVNAPSINAVKNYVIPSSFTITKGSGVTNILASDSFLLNGVCYFSGNVYFSSSIATGNQWSIIGTVPYGYRPSATLFFPATVANGEYSSQGTGICSLTDTGELKIRASSSSMVNALLCIHWRN